MADSIDFFALKQMFFTDTAAWQQVAFKDKAKNAFMMMRNIAIAYPAVVQQLNKIGMNQVNVLDAMQLWLVGPRQPRWSFTSGKKDKSLDVQTDADKLQKEIESIEDDVKIAFRSAYDIDNKLWNDLKRFAPDELLENLKSTKAQMFGVMNDRR